MEISILLCCLDTAPVKTSNLKPVMTSSKQSKAPSCLVTSLRPYMRSVGSIAGLVGADRTSSEIQPDGGHYAVWFMHAQSNGHRGR